MDYLYLSDTDCDALRKQRILALESDHYRLGLLIAEASDPGRCAELAAQQAVLEQAIAVHTEEVAASSDEGPKTADRQ